MLDNKLSIETPEQTALEFALAGIGSRGLALLYDSLIQFIVYFVLFLLMVGLMPGLSKYWDSGSQWAMAIWIFIGFALYWGYFALFEALWNGQTPGKRHAGIRVIKQSGPSINAFEAIARNFLRVVDSLPGAYAVGVITMFLSPRNQRLGDLVAGTLVVHDTSEEPAPMPLTTPTASVANAQQAARLQPGEVEAIETFLQRRYDLSPDVRLAAAKRLLAHVKEHHQLECPAGTGGEDFLEALVWDYRKSAGYR